VRKVPGSEVLPWHAARLPSRVASIPPAPHAGDAVINTKARIRPLISHAIVAKPVVSLTEGHAPAMRDEGTASRLNSGAKHPSNRGPVHDESRALGKAIVQAPRHRIGFVGLPIDARRTRVLRVPVNGPDQRAADALPAH
jgi:hypothetical protein